MILYFSGTGNSAFAAKYLAEKLNHTVEDAFAPIRSGESRVYTSETPWVFVSPTYAWQIPAIFRDYLLRCGFRGSRKAYFVMTCGDGIGSADAVNCEICREMGLSYGGTAKVVMPENYIAMFDAPDKNEAVQICRRAVSVLEKIARLILADKPIKSRSGLAGFLATRVVNGPFYAFFVKDRVFAVDERCTGCGLCARVCPKANIRISGNKPVWGGDCTHCMACITQCPSEAIEYGRKSLGKPRYRCPTREEILENCEMK